MRTFIEPTCQTPVVLAGNDNEQKATGDAQRIGSERTAHIRRELAVVCLFRVWSLRVDCVWTSTRCCDIVLDVCRRSAGLQSWGRGEGVVPSRPADPPRVTSTVATTVTQFLYTLYVEAMSCIHHTFEEPRRGVRGCST